MSCLSSRPHGRGQGAASSSLFPDHPRHFMSDRKRIQIALATSSTLSSQRSAVASCRSEHSAESQAPHILPHKFPQKTPNFNPPCSSPYLPTIPSMSRPTYQAKPIAQAPCSGLVQNIFSSPARLVYVSALPTPTVGTPPS